MFQRLPHRFAPRNDRTGVIARPLPHLVIASPFSFLSLRAPRSGAWQSLLWGRPILVRMVSGHQRLPRRFAPRNDRTGVIVRLLTPLSLRGSFCEPKQSRFSISQYPLGTEDCFVRAKDALPRNDSWGHGLLAITSQGESRPLGHGDCHIMAKYALGRNDIEGVLFLTPICISYFLCYNIKKSYCYYK